MDMLSAVVIGFPVVVIAALAVRAARQDRYWQPWRRLAFGIAAAVFIALALMLETARLTLPAQPAATAAGTAAPRP